MAKRARHERRDRSIESELKFQLSGPTDHARLRSRLRELGAESEGAYDEENLRFERTAKQRVSLRLRILDGGPQGILTAKGPATFIGRIKTREETEVEVTDSEAARDVLLALGYRVAFTYSKHRTTFHLSQVAVTLDVLDFGFFAEIEGPPDDLEPAARLLGLDPRKAIKASYSSMARKRAVPPPVVAERPLASESA
jgi:predicted adenylyl cyclase CyaB